VCEGSPILAHEKQKSKPLLEKEELPALTFDAGDVKVFLQQQSTAVLKEARDCFPKRTTQPKAAPKRGSKKRETLPAAETVEAQAETADGPEERKVRRTRKSCP